MADDLRDIVQRMIDAGETEENIASVIRAYPQDQSQNLPWEQRHPVLDAGGRGVPFVGGAVRGAMKYMTGEGAGAAASDIGLNLLDALPAGVGPARGAIRSALPFAKKAGPLTGDMVGLVSPRMGHAINLAKGVGRIMTKAEEAPRAMRALPQAADEALARPETAEQSVEYFAKLGKRPLKGWQKKAGEGYERWLRE